MCKALQYKLVPDLHIMLYRIAVHWFASTHSKKTRPILQLRAVHRVITSNSEVQFALNTKLSWNYVAKRMHRSMQTTWKAPLKLSV